jgi:hypothetical protein
MGGLTPSGEKVCPVLSAIGQPRRRTSDLPLQRTCYDLSLRKSSRLVDKTNEIEFPGSITKQP